MLPPFCTLPEKTCWFLFASCKPLLKAWKCERTGLNNEQRNKSVWCWFNSEVKASLLIQLRGDLINDSQRKCVIPWREDDSQSIHGNTDRHTMQMCVSVKQWTHLVVKINLIPPWRIIKDSFPKRNWIICTNQNVKYGRGYWGWDPWLVVIWVSTKN